MWPVPSPKVALANATAPEGENDQKKDFNSPCEHVLKHANHWEGGQAESR